MLPKTNRLNKQKDFDDVFKRGKIKQDGFLAVRVKLNQQKFSRFGFIVSSRAAKSAVTRNRLRRQLSEIIRLKLPEIKSGFNVVLTVKSSLAGAEHREMEKILLGLLAKLELYG